MWAYEMYSGKGRDIYICSPPPPGTHLFCVGHSPKFEKMSEIWHGLEFSGVELNVI